MLNGFTLATITTFCCKTGVLTLCLVDFTTAATFLESFTHRFGFGCALLVRLKTIRSVKPAMAFMAIMRGFDPSRKVFTLVFSSTTCDTVLPFAIVLFSRFMIVRLIAVLTKVTAIQERWQG